jgi:hypothetical protein
MLYKVPKHSVNKKQLKQELNHDPFGIQRVACTCTITEKKINGQGKLVLHTLGFHAGCKYFSLKFQHSENSLFRQISASAICGMPQLYIPRNR